MQIPTRLIAVLTGCVCAWAVGNAQADAPPPKGDEATHIELGIGIGGAHFADYPGASRYWNILLPLPYVTVRSPHLDANRDGVHGKVFNLDRWSLNVDFGGSVPVESSRDPERHGMPNLGWIAEAGPILRYRAWSDAATGVKFVAGLPVRAAASAQGLTLHHRGWVAEPELELTRKWVSGDTHYHADLTLSWLYATDAYFNYIYGVAPQYADATRPAYQAGGGYGGNQLSLGFGWQRDAWVYGAFLSYNNLVGAGFNTSPLVSQRHQTAFGFVVAWVFQRIDR